MRKYSIGLYEKAMPDSFSIKEKLQCAKKANYNFMELSIDASDSKIERIFLNKQQRFDIISSMHEEDIKIDSFCVSALTKYALGDLDNNLSEKGVEIAKGAIRLAYDIGATTVMIPGYDIYFGTSCQETKNKFIKNIQFITHYAAKHGIILAFETMENEFMNTVQKAKKYVDLLKSANLQIYPDCGNITNASKLHSFNVNDDLKKGKGNIIAIHLKETLPGVFRELDYGEGHVNFEEIICTSWDIGVRKFVTELWYKDELSWLSNIEHANKKMCAILDKLN